MLLSGKEVANQLHEEFRARAARYPRAPKLAVVLVGDNPSSLAYIKMKEKACAKVGILSPLYTLPVETSEMQLLELIQTLNHTADIDGILIQSPLPPHMRSDAIVEALDPSKDVDGFHPLNMGRLLLGQTDGFIPCTPLGIQVLLQRYHIPIAGKHVVIVGRSNIVGKPLAALLMQKKEGANATVSVVHSHSENIGALTRTADILIAAMGSPFFIKEQMVKEGAVVIDVGSTRVQEKFVGDVDFESVQKKCTAITPVPFGVGPMTVAMLLHNTLLSFERRCSF